MKILVIGVGLMGVLHARAVRGLRHATLCGVVDRSEAVARTVGADLDVPAFTDLRSAIDKTQPDAVIIATPDPFHREAAETAIERGLHVLIEKPLATTVQDAQAIIALANQRGTRLMTGHLLRFDPRYIQIVEAIRAGEIGRPVVMSAAGWSRKSLGSRVSNATSPLWYLLIHLIDALQWMSGGWIQKIDGAIRIESPAGLSAFTATGSLSTGASFLLAGGWTLPDGIAASPSTHFEVHGERKHVCIDQTQQGLTVSDEARTRRIDSEWAGRLRSEVEHFVSAIIDGSPFVITPEEAIAAVRSAAALEAASVTRNLV